MKSKSGALIGNVSDVKRRVVQSRDTIFFFLTHGAPRAVADTT